MTSAVQYSAVLAQIACLHCAAVCCEHAHVVEPSLGDVEGEEG